MYQISARLTKLWRPVIRSDLQWSDAIWPRTRVQPGRARATEIGDRKQSDSYTDMYACAPLSVSVTTQNAGRSLDVLPASRRFDRGSKQSSTKLLLPFPGSRTPHRWPLKDRPGLALPHGRYSLFILTYKLGFERFCSTQEWLRLVDFWLRALERCWRSCTPSTSGTSLKVKKPGSDPQRNCLDWRAL